MKKVLYSIMTLVILLVFVGCSSLENRTNNLFKDLNSIDGFAVLSSITLLDSMDTTQTTPLFANPIGYSFSKLSAKNDISDEEIDTINKYLGIMEQMLADDKPLVIQNETSDRSEYAIKMVISTKDLNGNVFTYIFYYNETNLNDNDDDEEEKDKDEMELSLEGIMVVSDKEYVINGKKEVEENEMKVEFTSYLDEKNYVKVVHKTENNEEKFEYTISENGVISKSKMKFESKGNETKLKLQFTEGNIEREYQFKREFDDGHDVIKIEINDENYKFEVKVYVVVDPETGEITYEYRLKDSNRAYNRKRENPHDRNKENDKDENVD